MHKLELAPRPVDKVKRVMYRCACKNWEIEIEYKDLLENKKLSYDDNIKFLKYKIQQQFKRHLEETKNGQKD